VPVASEWQLTASTPERALLEMLDELPGRESFHQVDILMEGLSALSPQRLQMLLADCGSVKVKRLFFWFAARHPHAWVKQVDRSAVDLGTGKRALAAIDAAMKRIAAALRAGLRGARVTEVLNAREQIVTKLTVQRDDAQIKIEVTPVLHGCVFAPETRTVSPAV
jgi:Transcriptional regulator, AbiEi antitoxin, Type IV TA system